MPSAKIKYLSLVIRILLIGAWILFALFPVYWMVITAFKAPKDIYGGPFYFPKIDFEVAVLSWNWLFTEGRDTLISALINSIVFATLSSLFVVGIASFSAYGLARFRYRYGKLRNNDLLFLILSQRMMPPIVAIFGLFLIYKSLGLLDSRPGMVLLYMWFNLPLAVFLLRDFFAGIPLEIEQAAAVDGYTKMQQLFKFILPMAKPALAATYMLCFIFAWNEFLGALIITFEKAQTLPVLIAGMISQMEPMWWIISALGIISIIPPAILAIFLDKYLVRGLLFGGRR